MNVIRGNRVKSKARIVRMYGPVVQCCTIYGPVFHVGTPTYIIAPGLTLAREVGVSVGIGISESFETVMAVSQEMFKGCLKVLVRVMGNSLCTKKL